MVLADTSVWIDHLRTGVAAMESLLERVMVVTHPIVIGELACGAIPDRAAVLFTLRQLPRIMEAENDEVLALIETHRLMGTGIGWPDAHLLTAAHLRDVPIWTHDKRLAGAAKSLNISYDVPALRIRR